MFMDGGVDLVLSRDMFPGVERYVGETIRKYGRTSMVGKKYLPVGSAMITQCTFSPASFLLSAPTMLVPQDVANTRNAYHAMSGILKVIDAFAKANPTTSIDEVVVPALCCGWGKMDPIIAAMQIRWAFLDHACATKPDVDIIHHERGIIIMDKSNEAVIMQEQPNFYENSEWKNIAPGQIDYR